jgi:hypothetical protein
MSDRLLANSPSNDESSDRAGLDDTGGEYPAGREPPRLRLFNVKYSPNLGDGLIAECLERGLAAMGGGNDIVSIDLAGRIRYGERFKGRAQIMSMLNRMPKPIRGQFIRPLLAVQGRRKWQPHYASGLSGASGAVIGGGNLIADIDLNFPTKLALAIAEIDRRSLPFAIYAVGVSSRWSAKGMAILRKALASSGLRKVFVRDQHSKLLWDQKFADAMGSECQVVRDPGLLAADFFPCSTHPSNQGPVAGVGITSYVAIQYHTESAPDPTYLRDWYVDLVRSLASKGLRICLFTNGSGEDVAYLAALRPALARAGGEAVFFRQPTTPAELCETISGLDVLIAHRLHAVMPAYSYRIPMVGLAWDRKLRSFMASVGRENWLCDVSRMSANVVAELARHALEEGIGEETYQQVRRETWEGIAQVLGEITGQREARIIRSQKGGYMVSVRNAGRNVSACQSSDLAEPG